MKGSYIILASLILIVCLYQYLKNLKHLNLKNTSITDKSCMNLKNLTSLEHLIISSNPQIENFTFLSNLTTLKSLYMGNCPQIKNLSFMEHLVNIEDLQINFCSQITNESLHFLIGLKNLKNFEFFDCSISRDHDDLKKIQQNGCVL